MNAVPETLTILANEHAANLARLDDKADEEVEYDPDHLSQPFCACGHVTSKCDGSRVGCGKGGSKCA